MSVPGKYSWSLLEGLVLIPFCNWTGSCVIIGVGPLLSEKHADQIWIPCGQLLLFPPGYHYFAVQKAFFHCMEVVGLRVTGGVFNHKDCNGLFIAHSLPARWPNKRCRTRQPVLVLTHPGDPWPHWRCAGTRGPAGGPVQLPPPCRHPEPNPKPRGAAGTQHRPQEAAVGEEPLLRRAGRARGQPAEL